MASPWLDIELRHLDTFRVLAEELSFRATAKRVGFAPSAVSAHISLLEQRVGERLVERGPGARGVRLTPAGEVFLKHAGSVLDSVAEAEGAFAHRARSRAATVRVGTFQSVSTTILAPALSAIQKAPRDVRVELVDTATPVADLLSSGIDIAFSETRPDLPTVRYHELLRDPYRLLARDDDARIGRGVISAETLAALPIITYRTSCHLRDLERELAVAGTTLRPILRHDDAPTIHSLVEAGVGVALLPRLAIVERPSLHAHDVEPTIRPRTICLCWNGDRQLSDSIAVVLETIVAVSGSLTGPATRVAPRAR